MNESLWLQSQCLATATRLQRMVNARVPEIKEDGVLSIVKAADATAVLPEPQKASMAAQPITNIILIFIMLIGGHVLHNR